MKQFLLLICLLITSPLFPNELIVNSMISQKISNIFKKQKIEGTFIVYDMIRDEFLVHNLNRAIKPYIPASTFKIPNMLIGLKTQTITDIDDIFYRHDGSKLFLKSWERDMSLKDAIKVSNLIAFQKLARMIGKEKMVAELEFLKYGNKIVGQNIDHFWLEGPLKISALQQVEFLSLLAQQKLEYPKEIQVIVADSIKLEQAKQWVLYGKTGLGTIDKNLNIGWFVGWLRNKDALYVFATNMDLKPYHNINKRIEVTKQVLQELEFFN